MERFLVQKVCEAALVEDIMLARGLHRPLSSSQETYPGTQGTVRLAKVQVLHLS